jgi:hypothetical protein
MTDFQYEISPFAASKFSLKQNGNCKDRLNSNISGNTTDGGKITMAILFFYFKPLHTAHIIHWENRRLVYRLPPRFKLLGVSSVLEKKAYSQL